MGLRAWRPTCRRGGSRSLEAYLRDRASLAGLVVTMDIRRGMTRLDEQLLRWLESRRVLPVAVLLTKADKLSRGAGLEQERKLAAELGPDVKLTRFSALTGDGVATAQQWVEEWLDPAKNRKGIKKPRVRDSGDAPGASTPAG